MFVKENSNRKKNYYESPSKDLFSLTFILTYTTQKMQPNLEKTADLVTFTEEIFNGKLHFLCSVIYLPNILNRNGMLANSFKFRKHLFLYRSRVKIFIDIEL